MAWMYPISIATSQVTSGTNCDWLVDTRIFTSAANISTPVDLVVQTIVAVEVAAVAAVGPGIVGIHTLKMITVYTNPAQLPLPV
jgi:hypothetical protein